MSEFRASPAWPPASNRIRILDAVTTLLAENPWPSISLTKVADEAGVSRQTIYNEFGDRSTLADLYVEFLVDRLVDQHVPVDDEALLVEGDVMHALALVLGSWFASVVSDPVLGRAFDRSASGGLFGGLVVDEAALVERTSRRLAERYVVLAPGLPIDRAFPMARVVARLCISYLLVPAPAGQDPVADLVAVLGPHAVNLFNET
ncbi:TetR/AcrR family transcriptional regulator [Nocardioides sp. WS12]|uniref:TetR/AcrR family transcriptional regulator n=1 Tax=Nocardioides sp. WS12 TaxID=2486272 RepID=UPI0015FBD902|nr:TetR/AcrR family transcriptional regulator [Nocardioides sp. WS12]